MSMPSGDRTGPPWKGRPRSQRNLERQSRQTGSQIGGSRVERYVAFIEALIPFVAAVSGLVKLFKKPKDPNALTDTAVKTENVKV